nr:MAG: RNA-dependent RNA polymerase [Riboviria sp.]
MQCLRADKHHDHQGPCVSFKTSVISYLPDVATARQVRPRPQNQEANNEVSTQTETHYEEVATQVGSTVEDNACQVGMDPDFMMLQPTSTPHLEKNQLLIPLHTDFCSQAVGTSGDKIEAGTQFQWEDQTPTQIVSTQTGYLEEFAPSAPPMPTEPDLADVVAEERNKANRQLRPVPPFWGRSSYVGLNCKDNKDFSHLPRFYPTYITVNTKLSSWQVFKEKLAGWWAKLPFANHSGKSFDVKIEQDLYYHLMLEMAFTSHTSKSLPMLKAKARRYLGQFDLSHISSGEYYSMIVNTCIAAYFTCGLGARIQKLNTKEMQAQIKQYEEELDQLLA